MDFYWGTVFKVGNYYFDFRPDSDEDLELLADQNPSKIGWGRTANVVHIDESSTTYEQITRRGIYEASHEHILADVQKRLSIKRIWTKILIGLTLVVFLVYKINWQKWTGHGEEGFREGILAIILVGMLFVYPFICLYQKRRKIVYLVYDITSRKEQGVQQFFDACFNLSKSEKCWTITGRERHGDTKHNAGAMSTVSRENAYIGNGPAKRIQTNIYFPVIKSDDRTYYFLPDRILYRDDNKLNVVSYEDLKIAVSTANFREEESIPSDSERVGSTWAFVNADGSPDRRFNNNYRIPIMAYCQIAIRAGGSFRLTVLTSNYECGKTFANALNGYKYLV